jgi:PPOX class probable F420-dependent enzyme
MAFQNLQGQQYMSLVTFRKTGEAVPTPVWFAQIGDRLYMLTSENAGKVKRIRNNPNVTVAPCTVRGEVLGEALPAKARILTDSSEIQTAIQALNRKYGLFKRLFDLANTVSRLFRRGTAAERVYLELVQA